MEKGKKVARFIKHHTKRFFSAVLIAALLIGSFTITDMYYDAPTALEVYAKELEGLSGSVEEPSWNANNIPSRDTTGTVAYYYAGNAFYALNQLNDGVQQSGSETSGHVQIYSDSNGARLKETTYDGAMALQGYYSSISNNNTFSQRTDIDFSTVWELMDTDAVWDDQYLYAQFKSDAFSAVTAAFAPTILQTVNDWFENGFSYDGSLNSHDSIEASGESWFSEAEKKAVLGATVTTDGNEGTTQTDESTDTLEDAKLFAPSIDEIYYNPVQIETVIANLAADSSDLSPNSSYQYARSYLWSRSFWGVNSSLSTRYGFNVNSSGQVSAYYVANEFAVAPAFYLDLEQVIMARSAQAGTNVTASSSLAAYNPDELDTSNGIKFLIQDDDFADGFSSSINGKSSSNIVAGNTYTVDYSGAVTSSVNSIGSDDNGKLVISAAIYDNSGNILYYGSLADVTGESGNVSITIPAGLSSGTYTLALFEEQLGGISTWETANNSNNGTTFTQSDGYGTYVGYETDYMSGFVAYMSITLADEEFEVTINDDAVLYAGVTYSARDIDELVSATVGSDSLTTGEYYVMTQEVYSEIGTAYSAVTTSAQVNTVTTAENPGNDATELTLVFVYYSGKNATAQVVERTFTVEADSIENSVAFDSSTWYQSTENDITWNYKLDGNGDIIGLYTLDSVVPIVDGAGSLNIPSKVAGRTVIAVGGGTEDTPVVPATETSWTSISFPSTVTTINDYGFYNTGAMANIVIPSHIERIGTKAFYQSAIISVKVNEMNGTIGSLAFGATYSMTNVTLKGGDSGLTVSTIAFRDSGAQSVTIKGNVTINKNAFKNNTRLSSINISGNVYVGEYAFTGGTAVDSLSISGTTVIRPYAFNNLTCLTQLYLPEGTTVAEYAFNGCTSLIKLETEVDLVNHSFEGCDNISILILGENVDTVGYDWEGHSGTYTARKVYVKNKDTNFDFYGSDGSYISAFGSTGSIVVYVLNDDTVDQGTGVEAADNVITLKGYTCYAHKGVYNDYITGSADSVTLYRVNSIDTQMSSDGVSEMADETSSATQTGIDAYYNGVILTTKDINKDNMTVIPVYGSDEGEYAYVSDAFYIIRTTEFNALENADNVTEEEVASYEPVHAYDEDLDSGQETGTISVTVIVFYEGDDGSEKYYSTAVTIRVEEYNAKSYVEQVYGSYEAIAEELASLTDKVEELEAQIEELEESQEADTATIAALQEELNAYKTAYEELVAAFAEFVSSCQTDGSGYFGTITDSSGNTDDVVYIEGNATLYDETDAATSDGYTIYTAEYDTDGDGVEETIYFYVDAEGVHLTDAEGNPTGTVYADALGALERETTAQLLEIKATLESCETGLGNIVAALAAAGYEIDIDLSIDEQYQQIVDSINDMAKKMSALEAELDNANDSVSSYEKALASIYALLTGSTLEADEISGISNALNAIIAKIESLQYSLETAQATVTDLQTQLEDAESEYSALAEELEETETQIDSVSEALEEAQGTKASLIEAYEQAVADGDEETAASIQSQIAETQSAIDRLEATLDALEQKKQDITAAQDTVETLRNLIDEKNSEISSLQAQLDALSDSADGFTMTVNTANELFGLALESGATDEEVYNAIVAYVQDKLSTDETIEAIQELVNSTNTGSVLVNDVADAIAAGGDSDDDSYSTGYSTGYSSGYDAGYDTGYDTGYAAGIQESGSSENGSYDTGYNAGYDAGYNEGYDSGYDAGYDTGTQEAAADTTNYDTGYNAGYNEGYSTGYSAGTSAGSSNYSSGYSTGYTEGYNVGYAAGAQVNSSSSDTAVTSLTTQIASLTSEVSSLTSENSELSSTVDALTESNDTLTAKVTSLTSSNTSLTEEVATLTSDLNSALADLKKANTASTASTATSVSTKSSTASAGSDVKEADEDGEDGNETEETTEIPQTLVEADETAADIMISGITTSVESITGLGTVVQLEMEEVQAASAESSQKGTGAIVKLPENGSAVSTITTNGSGTSAVSVDSLNNAYAIMEYYTGHLKELGELGAEEISSAAADDSKAVILETVVSADIKPSVTQEAAIQNGLTTKVNVSFDGIEDGSLYLVVHESEVRIGTYDVTMVKSNNGMLEFNLEDLSPITIAKVKVDSVSNLQLVEEQDVESVADSSDGGTGSALRLIVYGLIIVALLIALGVAAYLKLRGSSFIKEDEDDEDEE